MSALNAVELDSLLAEDNLLEIYKKAPSFASNTFNKWFSIATCTSLTLLSILHLLSHQLRDRFLFPFADIFNTWANAGTALAGTILGFLIASFAILCTILRPQTMIALQRLQSEKYNLSELKLLFVGFVDVMVQYLALLLWSIVALILGGKSGLAAMVGGLLGSIHWLIPYTALHVIFILWGTWLVMLVLTLKSFVYNLYQSLLLGLLDALDDYQRRKTCEEQKALSQEKQ